MANHSCELCTSLGVETKFWTLNDRKTHAQSHALRLGIFSDDGDQPSVKEIFDKCFPLDDFEEQSEEIEKSRSTLFEICKDIIKLKKNDSGTIECQQCLSDVRYMNITGHTDVYLIVYHAGFHSTKKPIACRQCPQVTTVKSNIVKHVKNVHKIASPIIGVHFEENWNECFDELKKSVMKCFDALDLDQQALSSKKQTPPRESSVQQQRRLIFSKIVENAKEDKKIHCDQCQKEIYARVRAKLEAHVYTHLHRRIFECKLCDVSKIHKCDIMTHVTKEHGVSSKGNYVDRSDDHHVEILDLVKKCFGKKATK